jgi:hypothetical protein
MGCTAHGDALTARLNYIAMRYKATDENDQKIVTLVDPGLPADE